MLKLSKIYFVQSKLAQAAFSTKCVLELSERTLGINHPAVGVVSQQLADLYTDLGSYSEAEYLYRQAEAQNLMACAASYLAA